MFENFQSTHKQEQRKQLSFVNVPDFGWRRPHSAQLIIATMQTNSCILVCIARECTHQMAKDQTRAPFYSKRHFSDKMHNFSIEKWQIQAKCFHQQKKSRK